MRVHSTSIAATLLLAAGAACTSPKQQTTPAGIARPEGIAQVVVDTLVPTIFEVAGTAAPRRQAILSTKLMGTVLDVLVKEGDTVAEGQTIVRIDARDLAAKAEQAGAALADAEAMQRDASRHAARIRALYSDSAATRAQLDAAETGLARAEAGVRTARAAAAELDATASYATIRAPFAGIIAKRFVDPGTLAAPGSPLVSVQDVRTLRVTANAEPSLVRTLRQGQRLDAVIEGRAINAVIEGVVPANAGNLSVINALVENHLGAVLSGSAATLILPTGMHAAIVIPAAAIVRQGNLTGVVVRSQDGDATRWIRIGRAYGRSVEVDAGLRAGEQIVVPAPARVAATSGG